MSVPIRSRAGMIAELPFARLAGTLPLSHHDHRRTVTTLVRLLVVVLQGLLTKNLSMLLTTKTGDSSKVRGVHNTIIVWHTHTVKFIVT
jgi:hypothetical protein